MDTNTLHDTFRRQLTNVHALTVLTVTLFEITGYIVLIRSGVEYFGWENRYLRTAVVLPIVLNVITHLIARCLVNSRATGRNAKNAVILAATLVTSFVLAVVHKAYIVTSCAFVFPMILSAMFNDRKLLTASFLSALFILTSVGVAFRLDGTGTLTSMLNLLVLFAFAIVSFFCGIISINFTRQNHAVIKAQAEKNDKLREDVRRDLMTGLYNHAAFIDRLEALMSKDCSFCLAMVDLDDFKGINDRYGHDRGDEVLIFAAEAIRSRCAGSGTAYRYGGEEFAVLFEGETPEGARAALQRALEDLRSHTFRFTDSRITFSAGLAAYTPGRDRNSFFEQADQTLYAAKRAGKNRILSAEDRIPV